MDSSSGVHSVCVCEIHQNCKLMAADLPVQVDYKMLLQKMVCDVSNRNYMLRSCKNCPGTDELEKHLKQSFLEHDFDKFDNVYFKQWVHREKGVTIVDMTLTVNDFIDQVCSLFDSLRWDYFIAKAQSQFLNELKENLQQN